MLAVAGRLSSVKPECTDRSHGRRQAPRGQRRGASTWEKQTGPSPSSPNSWDGVCRSHSLQSKRLSVVIKGLRPGLPRMVRKPSSSQPQIAPWQQSPRILWRNAGTPALSSPG